MKHTISPKNPALIPGKHITRTGNPNSAPPSCQYLRVCNAIVYIFGMNTAFHRRLPSIFCLHWPKKFGNLDLKLPKKVYTEDACTHHFEFMTLSWRHSVLLKQDAVVRTKKKICLLHGDLYLHTLGCRMLHFDMYYVRIFICICLLYTYIYERTGLAYLQAYACIPAKATAWYSSS